MDIHGGGWSAGGKNLDHAVSAARQGYVGASINYRLSGVAKFPAAVHDCKAAIRWLRSHAAQYHIDPDQIGVRGGSAGGHLVALLGTSDGDPYLEGDEGNLDYSSRVQTVVDFFGPIDFLKIARRHKSAPGSSADSALTQFFGRPINEIPEVLELASPLHYLDPTDPPVLIVHGEQDKTVSIEQSELFFAALRKAGVECRFVPVKNAGHGLKPFPPDARLEPTREAVEQIVREWFSAHLRPGSEADAMQKTAKLD